MKKRSAEYILYYFQLSFMGIFVFILIAYNLHLNQLSFLQRNMYSAYVEGIQLGDYYQMQEKGEIVTLHLPKSSQTGSDYMLYKYLMEDTSEIVRGIYGTADIFSFQDYIQNGRFFQNEDYAGNAAVAVIGSDILVQTFERNGKYYYGYNQELYEVIGVFRETGTVLDQTVYLNLTHLSKQENDYGVYYIDALDSSTVESVLEEIESMADYTTTRMEYQSAVIDLGLGIRNDTLLAFAAIASFLDLLLTTNFFVTRNKYTVAIQKLCGMTRRQLFFTYGRNIFTVISLAYLTILFVIRYFSSYMGEFFAFRSLPLYDFLICGLFLILLGVFTTIFTVRLADRMNISAALKGR